MSIQKTKARHKVARLRPRVVSPSTELEMQTAGLLLADVVVACAATTLMLLVAEPMRSMKFWAVTGMYVSQEALLIVIAAWPDVVLLQKGKPEHIDAVMVCESFSTQQ